MTIRWEETSQHSGPEESLGFLFWRASLAWRRAIETSLHSVGLSQPQFVVLAAVGWLTRGSNLTTQADLSRHIGLDANTVSQILRTLERHSYITRQRTVDERSKNPRLTENGVDILVKAVSQVEKADAAFFQAVENERRIFAKLLSSVIPDSAA